MTRIERIEVRKVTKVFGATPALRGVSVDFEAGTISFLEGPNGAGKSTLLSIIGTLVTPSSGGVHYSPLGENVVAARAQIGWVAHDSRCYRELTGRQNVELAARLYGIPPASVWGPLCERLQLERFAERSVASLSRGQRQRVALARALVHDPAVLLLDEPWSGLDAASSERLEQTLLFERDRGTLIIVVSHSQRLAERLGGVRVRLEAGRIASVARR